MADSDIGGAVVTRYKLEAAIASGLDAAAEIESRRTMERSLLISYIADAVEAEQLGVRSDMKQRAALAGKAGR